MADAEEEPPRATSDYVPMQAIASGGVSDYVEAPAPNPRPEHTLGAR